MTRRSIAAALLAGGLALACSDSAGPPTDMASEVTQERAFRPLSWQPMNAPLEFTAVGDIAGGGSQQDPNGPRGVSAGPPPLTEYSLRFWALVDETRSFQINWYEKSEATGVTMHPYLSFTVPAGSLDEAPNGVEYQPGDSVMISVKIDASAMLAHFEPSGLVFDDDNPAVLQYWYTGAGGDFNGDGTVDANDSYIEQNLLDMWMTQGGTNGWAPLWATQSISEDWFKAGIEHFTGFAVAY